MKKIKRFLVYSLALVLMVGTAFTFTACGKLNGKSYEFKAMTFTIITATETNDDGDVIVTETRELTSEEYYLYSEKHIALDKLSANKVEDSEKEAYENWLETIYGSSQKSTLSFDSKTFTMSERRENVNGSVEDYVVSGTYSENDGVYTVQFVQEFEGDFAEGSKITYFQFTLDDNGNVHYQIRNHNLTQSSHLVKGALYVTNIIYSEMD